MVTWLTIIAPLTLSVAVALYVFFRKKINSYYGRRVVALCIIAVVGPVIGLLPLKTGSTQNLVSNTDILFLVDLTYSMNAEDGQSSGANTSTYRLDQAQQDIIEISNQLEGSRFAIIAYDNTVVQYLPFTNSTRDTSIAAQTLFTKSYYQATRSPNFAAALTESAEYLEESLEHDDTRKQMIIIMTDGQLSGEDDTTDSVLEAAAALSLGDYSTAVIGYGGSKPVPVPTLNYDYDTLERKLGGYNVSEIGSFKDATTARDDDFLEQLAIASGGNYFIANQTSDLSAQLDTIRSNQKNKSSKSQSAKALDQNLLHIPLAMLAIRWLYLTELSSQPFARKILMKGSKK